MLARPASIALSGIVFSDYIVHVMADEHVEDVAFDNAVAICAIAGLCLMQMINTRLSTTVMSALTTLKLCLVLLLVLLGLGYTAAGEGNPEVLSVHRSFNGTSVSPPLPRERAAAFAAAGRSPRAAGRAMRGSGRWVS